MENPIPPPSPQEEPSVLDYLKVKLSLRRQLPGAFSKSELPAEEPPAPPDVQEASAVPIEQPEIQPVRRSLSLRNLPWRSFGAVSLALLAQYSLEPRVNRRWELGAIFYLLALGWLIWALWKGEWSLATPKEETDGTPQSETGSFRLVPLVGCGVFSMLAFLAFKGNLFTTTNLILWGAAILSYFLAFWINPPRLADWLAKLAAFVRRPSWSFSIDRRRLGDLLLIMGIFLIAIFFKTYQLNQVPPEMNSDHAEKLLDVIDVLNGQTRIFFPRNTGREAFQFYLITLTIKLFGTGISFLSMKIGTVLCGLLTLPFIYRLGKELGSRQAGLIALAFAGIAYWHNVISRLGLRFTLYPFFVAPTLYFLLRGLRRSNRNDFILAGAMLGIGLHSYTPIRILPLVVLTAVALYLLHRQAKGRREITIYRFFILILAALVFFLPLLRYAVDNPAMFALRAFTRLSDWERPLPGPAWIIFLKNLWNAMVMFAWNDGTVWLSSIPYRPALDMITGAFFYLGIALLIIRYTLRRHWQDLFLVLSVPLLMLPSILSLAFPEENPNLSRTAGALVPVFVIVGISIDAFLSSILKKLPPPAGQRLAWGVVIGLFILSGLQNYNLVFRQYRLIYETSSWNTSEMGRVVRAFTETMGSPDNVWHMAYPHWADSRLIGVNAGYPTKDYGILPENLSQTLNQTGAKLFLIYPNDENAVSLLQQMYPTGWLRTYNSSRPGKDFLVFLVPPE